MTSTPRMTAAYGREPKPFWRSTSANRPPAPDPHQPVKPKEKSMQPRFNFVQAAPYAYKAAVAFDSYIVKESGLEPRLIHLIKLRASQINGCAYCIDMHVKEARHTGMSEQWIHLICAWQESPIYDARERAVLAWTE